LVLLPTYPFQKSELFRRIHQDFVPMQLGALGVTFFFVLSGFIICWSYRPGISKLEFYRRRILKIYPTHLVAAAVFILAAAVPLSRLVVWVPNLLLIHTWVPNWTTVGGLNVPAWSLAAEILFYLSFPLAFPLVQRIGADRLLAWVAGLVLFILLLHMAYYFLLEGPKGTANAFAPRLLPGDVSPAAELHASSVWFAQREIPVVQSYWYSYNFPVSRLPEFYVGVIAARMVREGRWRHESLAIPAFSVAITYVATWFVPVNFKMSALSVGPMCALIATLAVRDIRGRTRVGDSRLLGWLGEVSYAFYLIQFPIMVLVTRFIIGGRRFGFIGWLGCAALCLALSVLAASMIYHWIDVPIMRLFRSKPRYRPRHAK
jgi:peptidoglycan/LPS O-acetylase OafA/YrhL